jgi:hypothetical protein
VRESLLVAAVAERLDIAEANARRRLQELRDRKAPSGRRAKVFADEPRVVAAGAERQQAIESLQRRPSRDDLLECEILEVLFTDPHTIEVIRQEVGADDIRHEALRELLTACFDLWDHGEAFSLGRLLAELECPQLKGLAVWLDDQARARGIADRLRQEAAQHGLSAPLTGEAGETEKPGENHEAASTGIASTGAGLLTDIVEGVKWRRACESQVAARSEWVANQRGPRPSDEEAKPELSDDAKDLLQRAAQFHRRRAAR